MPPPQFPRWALQRAEQLGTLFNRLVHEMCQRPDWVVSTLRAAADADEFTGRLVALFQRFSSDAKALSWQRGALCILRSDFMEHRPAEDAPRSLLQVEVNTISVGLGVLSRATADVHEFMLRRHAESMHRAAVAVKGQAAADAVRASTVPSSDGGITVVDAIAAAHRTYGVAT